ncbi:unnamed protein product, partial [Owenia fusiformis]
QPNILLPKMHRTYRKLSPLAKTILGVSFVLSIILYTSIFLYLNTQSIDDLHVLGIDTCPACYGTNLCDSFKNGDVTATGWSKLKFWHWINIKNVHTGTFHNKKVIMKKLAHDEEIAAIDNKICKSAQLDANCDIKTAIQKSSLFQHTDKIYIDEVKGLSDLVTCPSERLIADIKSAYLQTENKKTFTFQDKMKLMTMLMINPEPLMLQIFSAQEGWPVPKYYGACGRWIVEENSGTILGDYYDSKWDIRVDLAYQLFKLADKMTQNADYALYWTDVSYDNLVVDSAGKLIAIDLENVIVVDKRKVEKDKPNNWDSPHISNFDECPHYGNCLSFDTAELCSHTLADHNYYAICRDMLSNYASDVGKPEGFLHNMPDYVKEDYKLDKLLEQCANPPHYNDRLKIKDQIMDILNKLRTTHV